jgi:hypothetical protein
MSMAGWLFQTVAGAVVVLVAPLTVWRAGCLLPTYSPSHTLAGLEVMVLFDRPQAKTPFRPDRHSGFELQVGLQVLTSRRAFINGQPFIVTDKTWHIP